MKGLKTLIAINLIVTLLCCSAICYSQWNDNQYTPGVIQVYPVEYATAAPETTQNDPTIPATEGVVPTVKPTAPTTEPSVPTTDPEIPTMPTEPTPTIPGSKPTPESPTGTEPNEPTIPDNNDVPGDNESNSHDHVCNGDHVFGDPCVESYTAGTFEYIRSESCEICGYTMRTHWMIIPCTDPYPNLTKDSMDIFLGVLEGFMPDP